VIGKKAMAEHLYIVGGSKGGVGKSIVLGCGTV
jgi:hypothetical protein